MLVHNEFKKNREMGEIRKGTQRISKEKEKMIVQRENITDHM